MKQADRLNARYTVVIGDQELEQQRIAIKDMQSGESEEIALDQIAEFFTK